MVNYTLTHTHFFSDVLYNSAFRHISQGYYKKDVIHWVVGLAELCLPLIGQLFSAIEIYISYRIWKKPKNTQLPVSLETIVCEYLDAREVKSIKDLKALLHLPVLHQIKSLNISEWKDITAEDLDHLSRFPKLTHLKLSYNLHIGDRALRGLANLRLQHLTIQGCGNLTDAGMVYLANLPLQEVIFLGFKNITDVGLLHLTNSSLQSLNLIGKRFAYRYITDAGLANIRIRSPKLKMKFVY